LPVASIIPAVSTIPTAGRGPAAPEIRLSTGLYVGTIDAVDVPSAQMTFTISSSCGTPHSGVWTISFRVATFETNTDPATGMGSTSQISQAQWVSAVRAWKAWHILVPPSGVMDISDGPYGSCHGAYSFLP
jgi:hypothetical protein